MPLAPSKHSWTTYLRTCWLNDGSKFTWTTLAFTPTGLWNYITNEHVVFCNDYVNMVSLSNSPSVPLTPPPWNTSVLLSATDKLAWTPPNSLPSTLGNPWLLSKEFDLSLVLQTSIANWFQTIPTLSPHSPSSPKRISLGYGTLSNNVPLIIFVKFSQLPLSSPSLTPLVPSHLWLTPFSL